MDPSLFSQVDDYLSGLFGWEDEVLRRVEASIREQGMPEHSVSAVQGQFLFQMATVCRAKRIVEVGTLGGFSAICLGRALPEDGSLLSIEIDPGFAEVARQNIAAAGLRERVEVRVGDALEVLAEMEDDPRPVDLFFMDADKPNYIAYFDWALRHARPGSLILADNVIREGQVLDAGSTDHKVRGVRAYLDMLSRENRVVTSVLQQVGAKPYDGIALSVVW